jgi:hypothetical protein
VYSVASAALQCNSYADNPRPGTLPPACRTDYSAEAVEPDTAVVVIVLERENGYRGPCTMMGMARAATLNLAKPLGDRAVLPQRGEPVPVTRAAGTKQVPPESP